VNNSSGAYDYWTGLQSLQTYTLGYDNPPANYDDLACLYAGDASGNPTGGGILQQSVGLSAPYNLGAVWKVLFFPPGPWYETQGGDVYARSNLKSLLPIALGPPRQYFSMDGSGGYPGFVTYGGGWNYFDVSLDSYLGFENDGAPPPPYNKLSTRQWLVSTAFSIENYFDRMTTSIGGVGSPTPGLIANPLTLGGANGIRARCTLNNICFINGDTTISALMSVLGTDKYIVVISNGNLNINANVTLTAPGFIGFIVQGNVNIDDSVTSINGLYVAGDTTNGVFTVQTNGSNGSPADVQLTGSGIFIANEFFMLRNLGPANAGNPGAVFTHNPRLIFDMPISLWQTIVEQQEVAPRWPTPTPP
jgi:hypothetical protein